MDLKFSKAYRALYFIFLASLPLIYSSKIIDPVLIPRQMTLTLFVGLISLTLLIDLITNKAKISLSFLKSPIILLMLFMCILILASTFQAHVVADSLYVLSKSLVLLVVLILTLILKYQRILSLEFLSRCVTLFVLIVLVIFATQYIGGNDLSFLSSTMANKNLLSSALFLTWPFLLSLQSSSRIWKWLGVVLLAVSLAAIWLVQTKAVLVAALLFAVCLISISLTFGKKVGMSATLRKRILVSIITTVSVIGAVSFFYKDSLPHLFNTNTASTRLLLWENTGNMIMDHPLLGVGAGNWRVHFAEHGLEGFNHSVQNGLMVYQRPHNDFLWIFSELGVFGFVVYIMIFFFVITKLLRLIRHSNDARDLWSFGTLLSMIVGYIFIALVDFPVERIEHQVLLLLAFSFVISSYHEKFGTSSDGFSWKLSTSFVLLAVLFSVPLSAVVCMQRYDGEKHTALLKQAHAAQDWPTVKKEGTLAKKQFYRVDPMTTPIDWYVGVADFTLDDIKKATYRFKEAYHLTPFNIHVLNNLASCYQKEGSEDNAMELYLKALEISPNFEESLFNICAVHFNNGEKQKAFDVISKIDINTTNPKYEAFLPVVVYGKIDLIIAELENEDCIKFLFEVKNSSEKLIELFREAKTNSVSFESHVLQSCN